MTLLLEDLARLAAETPTPDERVRRLMAALQDISELESIFLSRVDIGQDRFEITHTHNAAAARHPIPEGIAMPWSESVCKHALDTGTAETHTARDQWPQLEVIEDLAITTYAIAPIRDTAGAVVGTLCAVSDRRKPVSTRARQAMKLVAQLVAPHVGGCPTATAAGAMDALVAPSVRDSMTSLPTRAALSAELTAALDKGEHCCLVMVDLVGLEAIDTRDGHWAADQFLYAVSQRLVGLTAAEPGALLARYGDREFAVMLRPPGPPEAGTGLDTQAVNALRERLAAATQGPYGVAWTLIGYDGAVVTTVYPQAREDASALLERAEEQMRHAGRPFGVPAAPSVADGR